MLELDLGDGCISMREEGYGSMGFCDTDGS